MAHNLIERIEQAGYSLDSIAGELVISRDELEKKISRETDFVYSEICYLRNLLNLTNKEIGAFFFDEGQAEADEEIERQNQRRNFYLIGELKSALEKINSNNTKLSSLLDLLSRCSDEGMGYDSISLNEIALNLARENSRLMDEAERACYEAF